MYVTIVCLLILLTSEVAPNELCDEPCIKQVIVSSRNVPDGFSASGPNHHGEIRIERDDGGLFCLAAFEGDGCDIRGIQEDGTPISMPDAIGKKLKILIVICINPESKWAAALCVETEPDVCSDPCEMEVMVSPGNVPHGFRVDLPEPGTTLITRDHGLFCLVAFMGDGCDVRGYPVDDISYTLPDLIGKKLLMLRVDCKHSEWSAVLCIEKPDPCDVCPDPCKKEVTVSSGNVPSGFSASGPNHHGEIRIERDGRGLFCLAAFTGDGCDVRGIQEDGTPLALNDAIGKKLIILIVTCNKDSKWSAVLCVEETG